MTREKLKLAYITNDASRKATFKKRKKGLIKKVSELSTLCGIDACAIIYGPSEDESQPEVWPNIVGAQRVVAQFKKVPEMEQYKKMMNQESFTSQRLAKAKENLEKLRKENREKELTYVMNEFLMGRNVEGLSLADINDLRSLADKKMKEIQSRMELLKKTTHSEVARPPIVGASRPLAVAPPPEAAAAPAEARELDGFSNMDGTQRPQFFMDLLNNPNEQVGFGHGDNYPNAK